MTLKEILYYLSAVAFVLIYCGSFVLIRKKVVTFLSEV